MPQLRITRSVMEGNRLHTITFFILIFLLLSACTPTHSIPETNTLTPTQTTSPSYTPTPSQTPTPTKTATPEPTPTPTLYANKEVWLAFYGNETGFEDKETYLYVGNIFEEQFVPVVEVENMVLPFDGLSIAWSNDAKKIAYVDNNEEGYKNINVVDLETGEKETFLTLWRNDIYIEELSWEKTGSTYFIAQYNSPREIGLYLFNVKTKETVLVGKDMMFTDWTPVERSFTYDDQDNNAIYQYYPDTQQAFYLYKYPRRGAYGIGDLSLPVSSSPQDFFYNTKSFLSSSCLPDPETGICDVGVRLLIPAEGDGAARLAWLDMEDMLWDGFLAENASLSPDGRWITYYYGFTYLFDIENSEAIFVSTKEVRKSWTLDWYEDSSAFILFDPGKPEPSSEGFNYYYPRIRVIEPDSLEDKFLLIFNEDSDYYFKIKSWNHNWAVSLGLDTIIVEPGTMTTITTIDP